MSMQVLICDDSPFARKQLARALPPDWAVEVNFAGDGEEALAAVREGRGELLFLDLNMPGMDGYQVLEVIHREDLPSLVVVVSGDVQPEARERVMRLGALDFVRKPVTGETIAGILQRYGIRGQGEGRLQVAEVAVDLLDVYRELANVAMGQAGDLLARLLGVFVSLPVPVVNQLPHGEVTMLLENFSASEHNRVVAQGFIGSGIAGEAFLMFHPSSIGHIARLMHWEGTEDDEGAELQTEFAGILVGAFLRGLADQLDVVFSQGRPVILNQQRDLSEKAARNIARWDELLAIEISDRIEGEDICCDLLLLFTGDSLAPLRNRAELLGGKDGSD